MIRNLVFHVMEIGKLETGKQAYKLTKSNIGFFF
jgi:hypothetical protein